MFFGLNEAHMRAQELKIGGFGTEFRDGAIGIGLRTQKYTKNSKKRFKLFFCLSESGQEYPRPPGYPCLLPQALLTSVIM